MHKEYWKSLPKPIELIPSIFCAYLNAAGDRCENRASVECDIFTDNKNNDWLVVNLCEQCAKNMKLATTEYTGN